ncbi:MAG: MFS transporter [Acidimicrobiales bacterium]
MRLNTGRQAQADGAGSEGQADNYKWIALSNTTIAVLLATVNQSIILIALPNIFRGIHLDPLVASNTSYLLWMLLGFLMVMAVLVVSLGRLGDMYGRVKIYNLGFAIFTVFSVLLTVSWMSGSSGALYLILMRVGQGAGAACLMANSPAILTDAFPSYERGLALGVNMGAAIAGQFIGLVLGGVLGPLDWRLVFLLSVPIGLFGTAWGYLKLEERGVRHQAKIDWWGNVTFAIGLIGVVYGITYGLLPYGGHTMGWTNPEVLGAIVGGIVLLAVFGLIETQVEHPMFRLQLFRIRAFSAGNTAAFLSAMGRGGIMFILIIWLQGIWLPQHGYDFARTPLWAGIYMLPLTAGFLIAGPLSGYLSDHLGPRPFATGGMLGSALGFVLLEILPVNFSYLAFAFILLTLGLAMGVFAAPLQAGVMNSLPADQRGSGSGMLNTSMSSAMVLSIGVFFTLIILGLSAHLPDALYNGLVRQGVPAKTAASVSHLPPVGSIFAAFLGYNPMKSLLGAQTLAHLPAARASYITGRSFFPKLISAPFGAGLRTAFDFAAGACVFAAGASWMMGKRYVHQEETEPVEFETRVTPAVVALALAPADD